MHGNDRKPLLRTIDKTVIVKLALMPLWGDLPARRSAFSLRSHFGEGGSAEAGGWGEGALIRKSKHYSIYRVTLILSP